MDTDEARNAAMLIKAVFDIADHGGRLHIVLEDWNLSKKHIQWCLSNIRKGVDDWFDEAEGFDIFQRRNRRVTELECANALLALTWRERGAALALAEEWFKP